MLLLDLWLIHFQTPLSDRIYHVYFDIFFVQPWHHSQYIYSIPGLPPELSIKVWKIAAQVPQVIRILHETVDAIFEAQPTKPGVLLANHESR